MLSSRHPVSSEDFLVCRLLAYSQRFCRHNFNFILSGLCENFSFLLVDVGCSWKLSLNQRFTLFANGKNYFFFFTGL